jgi:hypothetical protein
MGGNKNKNARLAKVLHSDDTTSNSQRGESTDKINSVDSNDDNQCVSITISELRNIVKTEVRSILTDFADRCDYLEKEIKSSIDKHDSLLQEKNIKILNELDNLKKTINEMNSAPTAPILCPPETLSTNRPPSAPVISATLRESSEREAKRNNLIIFNLPEEKTAEKELELIDEVYNVLGAKKDDASFKMFRIGSRDNKKIRPMVIKYEIFKEKMTLLSKAHKLYQLPETHVMKKVIIKPDLTRLQQQEEKDLIRELRRRRSLGENVKIFKGVIVNKED